MEEARIGWFDKFKRQIEKDEHQSLDGALEKLLKGPPEDGGLLPAKIERGQHGLPTKSPTSRIIIGNPRTVTINSTVVYMPPGVNKLTLRSLKEVLGVPSRHQVFMKTGKGWQHLADDRVLMITGGESFVDEAPNSPSSKTKTRFHGTR